MGVVKSLKALAAKRGADGRWIMENSFNGRTLVPVERKGAASKWITARALCALGRLARPPTRAGARGREGEGGARLTLR